MNLNFLLIRREIFGVSTCGAAIPPSPGIKPNCLKDCVPANRLNEIFLGFTADSRFLVSYSSLNQQFDLRFWLYPQNESNVNEKFQKPFAQLSIKKSDDTIHSEMFAVRFVQSISDLQHFVLIFSSTQEGDVTLIWGTLPDPNCTLCRSAAASYSVFPPFTSNKIIPCPFHFQTIYFCPDVYFEPFSSFNNDVFLKSSIYNAYKISSVPLPKCFRIFLSSQSPQKKSNSHSCRCFRLFSLGLIHPSICPQTGRLRLAWISQGGQIRVMSCSFSPSIYRSGLYVPKGSYTKLNSFSPPLAFRSPLMTSNYCSACFFWPTDSDCTNQPKSPVSKPPFQYDSLTRLSGCIFSSAFRLVSDNEDWPDGHCHPILFKNFHNNDHACIENISLNTSWTPSLLTARDQYFSCLPINYLSMLQDIRASYIHWTLVPRKPIKLTENAESRRTDNDSPSLSLPLEKPEILVANQLCGQCHSYFDPTEWQQMPVDICEHLGNPNVHSNIPLVVHFEEVLFDLPETTNKFGIQSELILFSSPLEPDWLLVYEVTKCPSSSLDYLLITIISISSGKQYDPDEEKFNSKLKFLTSTCPSLVRFSGIIEEQAIPHSQSFAFSKFTSLSTKQTATTLLELNNYSAANYGQSVSHIADHQGGYVFHI